MWKKKLGTFKTLPRPLPCLKNRIKVSFPITFHINLKWILGIGESHSPFRTVRSSISVPGGIRKAETLSIDHYLTFIFQIVHIVYSV